MLYFAINLCRCISAAARWRLPAEWLAESDLDTALLLEELSPFKSQTSGFDFLDFESLRAPSLGVSDEVFPLCVGGTAFNNATPTWA